MVFRRLVTSVICKWKEDSFKTAIFTFAYRKISKVFLYWFSLYSYICKSPYIWSVLCSFQVTGYPKSNLAHSFFKFSPYPLGNRSANALCNHRVALCFTYTLVKSLRFTSSYVNCCVLAGNMRPSFKFTTLRRVCFFCGFVNNLNLEWLWSKNQIGFYDRTWRDLAALKVVLNWSKRETVTQNIPFYWDLIKI